MMPRGALRAVRRGVTRALRAEDSEALMRGRGSLRLVLRSEGKEARVALPARSLRLLGNRIVVETPRRAEARLVAMPPRDARATSRVKSGRRERATEKLEQPV